MKGLIPLLGGFIVVVAVAAIEYIIPIIAVAVFIGAIIGYLNNKLTK